MALLTDDFRLKVRHIKVAVVQDDIVQRHYRGYSCEDQRQQKAETIDCIYAFLVAGKHAV